jgi:sulfur-oxidizing protein SoxY
LRSLIRRRALQSIATAAWWLPAVATFAQANATPLDQRVRAAKVARGGLSLDIPSLAESGASVPVVLFVDAASLTGRTVTRFGIIAPQNPRPVALEIELGPLLSQSRLTTSIRLGATQPVTAVAQLSDGTLWQHTVNVMLTGSACYDGT